MPSADGYICRVDVTIRAYEPRDAADLADVFFRSVRQVALSAYTADQVRAWAPEPRTAEWAHGEASDGRLVLVAANADDRPVAYIDLEPDGHIDRLFCAPEAAGQGIASRLYDAVEAAAARDLGIRSLFTEVSELARRLFERKGFAVAERQDLVIRGVAIHNYRMAKTLDLPPPHLTWSGWPDLNRPPLRPEPRNHWGRPTVQGSSEARHGGHRNPKLARTRPRPGSAEQNSKPSWTPICWTRRKETSCKPRWKLLSGGRWSKSSKRAKMHEPS